MPSPFRELISRILYTCRLATLPEQRRYIAPWLKSLRPGYLLSAQMPWITFNAIDFLETQNLAGARIFEYGSGGSTLYWLRRGAELVSIEHDAAWYSRMQHYLPQTTKLDYRLIPSEPESDLTRQHSIADPLAYHSADSPQRNRQFRRYVMQIDTFPDSSFDLILIDGRARPSCAYHALPKLRKGGLLILDNADRRYYTEQISALQAYKVHCFIGPIAQIVGLSQTNIYQHTLIDEHYDV